MKRIIKNPSPQWFEEWKREKPRRFENMKQNKKEDLKNELVKEQGYICCYCGRKIDTSKATIIDHFLPKDDNQYPHFQLEYNNLFASCDGYQKERKEANTRGEIGKELYPPCCDSLKNNEEIPICPIDKDCEEHFKYFQNGLISVTSEKGKVTLETLGLNNNPNLVNLRKDTITGKLFQKVIINGKAFNKPKKKEELEKIISNIEEKDILGKFSPFCFAIKNVAENLIALQEVN